MTYAQRLKQLTLFSSRKHFVRRGFKMPCSSRVPPPPPSLLLRLNLLRRFLFASVTSNSACHGDQSWDITSYLSTLTPLVTASVPRLYAPHTCDRTSHVYLLSPGRSARRLHHAGTGPHTCSKLNSDQCPKTCSCHGLSRQVSGSSPSVCSSQDQARVSAYLTTRATCEQALLVLLSKHIRARPPLTPPPAPSPS